MAVLAIAAAGAVAGGAIGYGLGYVALGASLGWAIGSYIGSSIYGTELDGGAVGPRLDDLTVPGATSGTPMPDVFGSYPVTGTVIWTAGIDEDKHHSNSGGGGKGGGGGSSTTYYTYSASFAVALCAGEITGIGRIWLNNKIFQDRRLLFAGFTSMQYSLYTVYTGSETQEPDPTIQAHKGAANTPAYRGTAYIVFENLPLADYGNALPVVKVEVFKNGISLEDEAIEITLPTLPSPRVYTDMKLDLFGNAVLVDNETKYFTICEKVSNKIIDYVKYPSYGAWDYSTSDWHLQGYCFHPTQGFMVSIWRPDNAAGGKKVTALIHDNVAGSYGNVLIDRDLSSYPAWVLYPHYAFITACTIDYNNRLLLCDEWFDEIIIFDDIDDVPAYDQSIHVTFPPGQSSGNYNMRGMAIHPDTRNLWICFPYRYMAEYQGSTSGTLLDYYYDDWGNYNWCDAFDYDQRSNLWLRLVNSNNTLIVHDEDWTIATGDLTTYGTDDYPALSDIIQALCIDAGLTAGQLDVTDLSGITVAGYSRGRVMTAKQAIEPLLFAYLVDVAEVDKKLVFVRRGVGSSVVSIEAAELAATVTPDEKPDNYVAQRVQEGELPRRIEVKFINQAWDYEVDSRYYELFDVNTKHIQVVDLPIVMGAGEALDIAYRLLMSSWIANEKYFMPTTSKYIYLAPTDVFTVDGIRLRIVAMGIADGVVNFETATEFDTALFDTDLETDENIPDYVAPFQPADTLLAFLDIPALAQSGDTAGFYMGAYFTDDEWRGGVVDVSIDGGSNYSRLAEFAQEAAVGATDDALDPDASPYIWDNVSQLTVQLATTDAELESSTEEAVLNGANAAAVSVAAGGWEIVQFVNVVDNGYGNYTLSKFLRGRRGSEWAMGGHAADDVFVLLDAAIQRIDLGVAAIGLSRTYRATSLGALTQQTDTTAFALAAVCLKPWAVDHVRGVRDGSGNLAITWLRRDRIDGEWRDSVDVGQSEAAESYEIDILAGATVVRTITAATPAADYTAAQQTADFGSAQGSVDIEIYQISAVVGRGYGKAATL